MSAAPAEGANVLQFMFAAMWRLTEGDPAARKALTAAAEAYNRRMDEFNGHTGEGGD